MGHCRRCCVRALARRRTTGPFGRGFVVLLAALVIAAVGGLIVDIPAILLGVKITSEHTPPGIEFADTVVQDVAFVLTAVLFAQIGGRKVRSWQFGYRSTPARRAARLTVLTIARLSGLQRRLGGGAERDRKGHEAAGSAWHQ